MWIQIWHVEFGGFSSNHSKVQKFHLNELLLSKVYVVWAWKLRRSYLLWQWIEMQNLNEPWPCSFKNDIRNWVNLYYSIQKSEKLYIYGLFLSKAYNVSARNFQRDYVSPTLKGDAKFKEKLTHDLKNDIRNLVNFHVSSWKPKKFHFDWVVCPKHIKI